MTLTEFYELSIDRVEKFYNMMKTQKKVEHDEIENAKRKK